MKIIGIEKIQVHSIMTSIQRFARFWLPAYKQVFPLYIALQVILVVLSFAVSFLVHPMSSFPLPHFFSPLWQNWLHADTIFYLAIAEKGYDRTSLSQAAFFPLYPLLIHSMTWLIPDALLAGLIIARVAGLFLMMVLYQFVKEEFDETTARRSLLCLITFPTAFFLWAAYPEALFLFLTVSSFYAMRRKRWWLAGICGLCTCLLRPNGIFLVLPLGFEYLWQCEFRWQAIRWNILSIILLPAGLFLFALYCYFQYGDLFAFVHGQESWQRSLQLPWYGLLKEFQEGFFRPTHILAFSRDLLPDLLALLLIGLGVLGFWRLGPRHWTYVLYAAVLWLFVNSFPSPYPLMGTGRNVLLIFPLFLMLAQACRYRWFSLTYLLLTASFCLGWLLLFLIGYSVV